MEATERTYTTIDRSGWESGAWDSEPDKVQFIDTATGLPCLAKRNHYGNWCGYVGVSAEHPLFGVAYNSCPHGCQEWCEHAPDYTFEVHGGLTYSDACEKGPEATSICHIPAPGEPDHVWWFGFDCGHAYDLAPGLQAEYRRYGIPALCDRDIYRTLEYVRGECASLAAQLAAFRA
jgi:hypothetical protein